MDAAQILKPFAHENIPADIEKSAAAEHLSEIITMKNVNKSYKMGSGSLHVLKDISLTVEQGEYLAILGPSGVSYRITCNNGNQRPLINP